MKEVNTTGERVIFLDVDGVLCTPLSARLNRLLRLPMERQRFDPLSLFWLRWLVRRTGAVVVLSSSWRDGLMLMNDPLCRAATQNLFARLRENGTPLADVTPLLPSGDKSGDIAAWLGCSPCESYVILDDNDCFSYRPEIRAHWICVPGSRGLRGVQAALAARELLAQQHKKP